MKTTEIAMVDLSRTRAHEQIRLRSNDKSFRHRILDIFKHQKVVTHKMLLRVNKLCILLNAVGGFQSRQGRVITQRTKADSYITIRYHKYVSRFLVYCLKF